MSFKITARTLLHLGAELISSDAVAIYELIKNAFDANSSKGVKLSVTVRIQNWPGPFFARLINLEQEHARIVRDSMNDIPKARSPEVDSQQHEVKLRKLRADLIRNLDPTAPDVGFFEERIGSAADAVELRKVADSLNTIVIEDTGHGMSISDLTDIYLTLGTRNRRKERQFQQLSGQTSNRPILGEKGLGRLSVMRLGQRVRVETTTNGDERWNILEIDWSRFSHDSDDLLEDILIEPSNGEIKTDRSLHETKITISALNATWTKAMLDRFAKVEAAKFNSPFEPEKRYRISLRYNGESVPVLDFDKMILNNCHAYVSAELEITGDQVALRGRVDYRQRGKEKTFVLTNADLLSASGVNTLDTVRSLGPFTMEVYWYNRRLLQKKDVTGLSIGEIINLWSGGLMVFRDGFRVLPYGDEGDDWLNMDPKAFASAGFKVNRKQIIGRVSITASGNPSLTDQTNREGLRETPEKQALVNLLKTVLESELRQFLNTVDNDEKSKSRLTFDDVGERLGEEKKSLRASLAQLRKHRSNSQEESLIFDQIDATVETLEKMMADAQNLAEEFERGRSQVIHLAGLGLMVEFLAHELNRATQHALRTLSDRSSSDQSLGMGAVKNLELQLKTLQKRLSSLDPTTTSGRNRKEKFDLFEVAQQILDGHAAAFNRHEITDCSVRSVTGTKRYEVKMVKGMVIQILENLITNSLYWVKQQQRIHPNYHPSIFIEIDPENRFLKVVDNGPGVSEQDVPYLFDAFFTRKPPGSGKGLGLYISREIAHYHDATLDVTDCGRFHADRYNSFTLTLAKS